MDISLPNNDYFELDGYKDTLWTCQMCTCGFCLFECQAYKLTGLETAGARGRNQLALGILNGELNLEDVPDLMMYVCTTCRYCEEVCALNLPLAVKGRNLRVSGATTSELLRSMKVEAGKVPVEVRDVLNNFEIYGNPYGLPHKIKDDWVKGLGSEPMDLNNKEVIFYVGAFVPYEDRATIVAEAIFNVLRKAGLAIGMLGSKELSSGGLVRPMGEEGLFEVFVNHCSKIIKENNIKRIICLSPHDYDAFHNYYEELGIKVEHYTETIANLIKEKKLRIDRDFNKKVTYQDPCYLGRRNKIYEPPREILNSIPGLELIEMNKVKTEAHCCGGGGVGLWMDFPEARMDLQRVDEANETGAEVLATACPICLQMLDNGIKARDYKIEVKDIGLILQDCII